jgi:hypothetical protein
MSIRRASVILPGNRLEDFPTHLTDQAGSRHCAMASGIHSCHAGAAGAPLGR